MTDWFARPVLHVADVEASLRFYVNRLGFTSPWRYDEDGRAHVAQVDRQGCALILADTWPEKIGKGLMFHFSERRAADARRRDRRVGCVARGTRGQGRSGQGGFVGYRLLVVDDPDGNQLFFNYPSETASDRILREEA